MTEGIVNMLEPVEIDQGDSKIIRPVQCGERKRVLKRQTVGSASEKVMQRGMTRTRLAGRQFGYFSRRSSICPVSCSQRRDSATAICRISSALNGLEI